MTFLNDDLERGVRMCVASLYERDPEKAGLFLVFGPWKSGEITPFAISAVGERKLKRAFTELGDKFELHTIADNDKALRKQFGVGAALAMNWLLIGLPPLEHVVEYILARAAEEVPRCTTAPESIEQVVVVSEVIRIDSN